MPRSTAPGCGRRAVRRARVGLGRAHAPAGLAVLIAVAVWGAGIVAFGLSGDRLVLALSFLAIAGWGGCDLGRVPIDDPTTDGAGRTARKTVGVQHPRRRGRTASRRLRGRCGRGIGAALRSKARRRSALTAARPPIDHSGAPRLTANRGGVFGGSTPPETRDQGGVTRCTRSRARRLRGSPGSAAGRRAAAHAGARCARRRVVLRDSVVRARTTLLGIGARGRTRGRLVDRVAEEDVVRRDRSHGERRTRCRPRERSRRQQGVRGRRHLVRAAFRLPAPGPSVRELEGAPAQALSWRVRGARPPRRRRPRTARWRPTRAGAAGRLLRDCPAASWR